MMTYEQEIDLNLPHPHPTPDTLSKKSDRTPLSYANNHLKNFDKSNVSIKIRSSPTRSPSCRRQGS